MKEIEEDTKNSKDFYCHALEKFVLLKCSYLKKKNLTLQMSCNSYANINDILHKTQKESQCSYRTTQNLQKFNSILSKNHKAGGTATPEFTIY